jgi:hypothetical protein
MLIRYSTRAFKCCNPNLSDGCEFNVYKSSRIRLGKTQRVAFYVELDYWKAAQVLLRKPFAVSSHSSGKVGAHDRMHGYNVLIYSL